MKKLILVLLLLTSPTPDTSAQTARDVAQEALQSTVVVIGERANGRQSLGSGFFVRDNVVATNYHVIKDARRIYVNRLRAEPRRPILSVLAVDADNDLALLRVNYINESFLWFGNSCVAEVGDTVFVAGNPEGLEGTFSQGIISSVRYMGKTRYFQITAPISSGSSGGPVMDASGEVIGVATASMRRGQNLNFAVSGLALPALILKTLGPGFGVDSLVDLAECVDAPREVKPNPATRKTRKRRR